MSNKPFRVDIDQAYFSKTGRHLPSVIRRIVSRIICEQRINKLLSDNVDVTGVAFMTRVVRDLGINLSVRGEEHLPPMDHRCIFVCNHPLGGADGVSIIDYIGNKYQGKIRYIVNDLLYQVEPLKSIFLPVNKHGRQHRERAVLMDQAMRGDDQILTFPAGFCSRPIDGVIQDIAWNKQFVTAAIKYERDIIPMYFDGLNSKFFYTAFRLRRLFGIKTNLEMALLPREFVHSGGKPFTLTIGEKIPYRSLESYPSHAEAARDIRRICYRMGRKNVTESNPHE